MTVNVGVIGVGMIGKDHIRRLTTVLAGAGSSRSPMSTSTRPRRWPTACRRRRGPLDRPGRSSTTTTSTPSWSAPGGRPTRSTCWPPSRPASRCSARSRWPPPQEACRRIIDAEVAFGRRLVQVGYMRRYDAAYRALKAVVDSGDIGAPLMMHCTHRNPSVPGHYTKDMAITDTAVHEIDMVRWMFGEEIVAHHGAHARARAGNGGELQDPLFLLLEMASGALVDVEISVNIRYGYDIRGEVVGEDGTAALGESSPVIVRPNNTCRRPGAGGLARAVHPRLRRRVPGMDRRRPRRRRRSARAPGTAMPPRWSPTRRCRRCTAAASGSPSSSATSRPCTARSEPHAYRARPVHAPAHPAAGTARRRRRSRLRIDRAVAPRGLHPVLPPSAGRSGHGSRSSGRHWTQRASSSPRSCPCTAGRARTRTSARPRCATGSGRSSSPSISAVARMNSEFNGRPEAVSLSARPSSGARWRSCCRSSSARGSS